MLRTSLWRLLFRLLYQEFAFAYDMVSSAVSLGGWRSWQRAALRCFPAAEAGPVLELAHGTGDLQIDLIRAGYHSIALDLSLQMGKLARRKLRRATLPANLIRGDAFYLPCKSRSFAAIVCTFPTPFIFSEPVLAEMARVLRPSGRAVIVLVGQLRGAGILPMLIRSLYRISGQRDAFLSRERLRDFCVSGEFEIASEIVALPSSAVQLLILTKPAGSAALNPDLSLESAATL